jgi:penicillin G amidase
VLAVYDLATSAPVFGSPTPLGPQGDVPPEGSNNWVLAGSRTRSGRPLLANDPHRAAAAMPGLRYIAHLSAPGFDVIGGGEPALPGISIGHNGRIAFGLTIFAIDQEDLYVYETDPADPHSYRYQDRWEPMRRLTETILVRDGEPVEVELLFTRHGPVIYQDPARRTAFAVRAAWLEPGMAPYLGSMDYMRARNHDEFLAAMNRWGHRRRTRSTPIQTARSPGRPAGSPRSGRTGTARCRCPATGVTSGPASTTPTSSPAR